MSDKRTIPDRWLRCPRKASQLLIDKFMPFKTPLSERYNHLVSQEYRFPPKMLFEICKVKRTRLGLWIDLTNTDRFYDKNDVKNEGCQYVKLSCRGHGETPSKDSTDEFVRLVYNFILQHPLEKIGVHCTHGFNRTGFMLVSYLVEKEDFDVGSAIEAFAAVRPPGIYKGDYLRELFRRYDVEEDTPLPPSLPNWCFEDEYVTAEACPSMPDDEASPAKRAKRSQKAKAKFMKGVSGVELLDNNEKARSLQKKIQMLCKWKRNDFPGSQPVSMDRNNITLLNRMPYVVSWKADGTRYMMLIDGPREVYFFDRDNSVFKVDGLCFPQRCDLDQHLKNTLLDGEMVIDKVGDKEIPRYLVYDIVTYNGKDISNLPFYPNRLKFIETEVIQPRHMAMEKGMINKMKEPFSMRKKDFWPLTTAASLLSEKFEKTLSHEPDGLIFQPAKEPYVSGRCHEVLKWKPLTLNSIDFKLNITTSGGEGKIPEKVCELYVCGLNKPYARMKYRNALKEMHNKIVECKLENKQWIFMRERTDKSFPNGFETAEAVSESIKHPVTKEMLLDYIKRYRYGIDNERMPPPKPPK